MAVIDRRDKTLAYRGGSSLLAVGLSAANAQTALGDPSATAGWYVIGYLAGGTFGPERESEELKDEAGVLVATIDTSEYFIVTNTAMQSDDATLSLLDWLEDASNAQLMRYSLPTNDSTENQWIFLYSATIRKENWTITTGEGENRARQFTVLGAEDASGVLRAIVTLPVSQADSAWDDYAEFKDSAFA